MRRKNADILVGVGIAVGFTLLVLGGSMVIPAAWMAGGGDMPTGHGVPSDMNLGLVVLYASIGAAIVGVLLILTSAITGIVLLITRWKNGV